VTPTNPPTPTAELGKGGFCDGEFVPYPDVNGMHIASYFFASLILLGGVAATAFVVIFRAKPIMRMSQREFLGAFSFSIAVIGASLIPSVLGLHAPSVSLCLVHDWLFMLSLSFALSCLLVKEWRVWKVYKSSQKLRMVRVTNKTLFGYISILMIVPVVLLILGSTLGNVEPDPCKSFSCTTAPSGFALYGYIVLLAVLSCIMAVFSRGVPSVGGESAGILYSVTFTVFALALLGLIFLLGVVEADVETLILSFAVCGCCIVALGFIVFRKAWWFDKTQDEINTIFLLGYSNHSSADSPSSGAAKSTYTTPRDVNSTLVSSSEEEGERLANLQSPKSNYGEQVVYVKEPASSMAQAYPVPEDNSDVYLEAIEAPPAVNSQVQASVRRSNGFKIAEDDQWEEYVDRENGESFWVDKVTNEITTVDPFM